ncbi:ATP-binding cassette domain-containing protein [Desulfonatronum thioautotrophicum]|uniref:ATP-binding cassette domain-containing protein n=1 Tax=Desulfonatronum thioautotrophicum TaxID=617001 RepID=UPI0005EB798A|nr:ATP-binding cassette domain-containing protein [Desulfonatronum thioautotrophicum]
MFVECRAVASLSGAGTSFNLDVDFTADSSSIVLFGPSGSGKSLTLLALAGLLKPASGRIIIHGKTFFDHRTGVNIPAQKRRVGFVFQDYALFPHLTVWDNVAFGLKRLFRPLNREQRQKVNDLLELFGIGSLAHRRPHQISGGQRQRTALVRALAPDPSLLLLDEPFTALDQPLRAKMREELARIQERFNVPMVMVSHDLADVDAFAETLVAFGHGRVLEVLNYRKRRSGGESATDILTPLFEAANGTNAVG